MWLFYFELSRLFIGTVRFEADRVEPVGKKQIVHAIYRPHSVQE
jgi:hypothetical protein